MRKYKTISKELIKPIDRTQYQSYFENKKVKRLKQLKGIIMLMKMSHKPNVMLIGQLCKIRKKNEKQYKCSLWNFVKYTITKDPVLCSKINR